MTKKLKSLDEVIYDHHLWLIGDKKGHRLTNAVLKRNKLRLSLVNISGAVFDKANIPGADFTYSNISDCSFKHANLHGSNFVTVDALWANFDHANLRNSSMSGRLTGISLRGADVTGSNIVTETLYNADLRGTKAVGTAVESMVGYSNDDESKVRHMLAKSNNKYVERFVNNAHKNIINGDTKFAVDWIEELYKDIKEK